MTYLYISRPQLMSTILCYGQCPASHLLLNYFALFFLGLNYDSLNPIVYFLYQVSMKCNNFKLNNFLYLRQNYILRNELKTKKFSFNMVSHHHHVVCQVLCRILSYVLSHSSCSARNPTEDHLSSFFTTANVQRHTCYSITLHCNGLNYCPPSFSEPTCQLPLPDFTVMALFVELNYL